MSESKKKKKSKGSTIEVEEKTEEEQVLTCPGCRKMLREPVALACIHVFCRECISKLKRVTMDRDGTIGVCCKICDAYTREVDILASVLMDALVMEYKILEAYPRQDKLRPCDQCSKEDTHWRCVQCKMFLCEKCGDHHQRIPYCKGHEFKRDGWNIDLLIDKVVFCDIHQDNRVEFNCADCEEPLCEGCAKGTHAEHKIESIDEALERLVPIYRKHCKDLDDEIELLQRDVDTLDTRAEGDETAEPGQRQELEKIRDHVLDIMTKYHTLRWWITLTIDRTRDAFLLKELQGYVHQRLLENNRIAPKTPEEAPVEEEEEPRPEPIPVKRPDDKKPKPVKRKPMPVFTRYSDHAYREIFNHRRYLWLKDKVVELSGDGCTRMGYINGAIWLPVRDMDHIKVLEQKTGHLVKVIELPEKTRPWCVQQVTQSTVVMTAESGLFCLDLEGQITNKIHDGTFCDVNGDGVRRFVCLEYTANKALIFSTDTTSETVIQNHEWKLEKTVKLCGVTPEEHRIFSSAMMVDDAVAAGSNTHLSGTGLVRRYTSRRRRRRRHDSDSDELESPDYDMRRPKICGIDHRGDTLIADAWRDKLLLLDRAEDTVAMISLHHRSYVKGPRDVLLLADDCLWVLMVEAMGNLCLVRYVRIAHPDKSQDDSDPEDLPSDVIEDSPGSDTEDDIAQRNAYFL